MAHRAAIAVAFGYKRVVATEPEEFLLVAKRMAFVVANFVEPMCYLDDGRMTGLSN